MSSLYSLPGANYDEVDGSQEKRQKLKQEKEGGGAAVSFTKSQGELS